MQPILPRWLLVVLAFLLLGFAFIAAASNASAGGWNKECRGYSPAKTVRCIAAKQDPPGGVAEALSVWHCESNFGVEPSHSDSYHGPFQYLRTTYANQRTSMPDIDRWYGLSVFVHNWRSNIITAVSWAARHGWGPWGCA